MSTIGFVDFNYPKRYEIPLSEVIIEDCEVGSNLRVLNLTYPRIDQFKLEKEDPCLGMEGWVTLKDSNTTIVLYFKESQKDEVITLFNQLEFITTVL